MNRGHIKGTMPNPFLPFSAANKWGQGGGRSGINPTMIEARPQKRDGAGGENRTRVISLEGWSSMIDSRLNFAPILPAFPILIATRNNPPGSRGHIKGTMPHAKRAQVANKVSLRLVVFAIFLRRMAKLFSPFSPHKNRG